MALERWQDRSSIAGSIQQPTIWQVACASAMRAFPSLNPRQHFVDHADVIADGRFRRVAAAVVLAGWKPLFGLAQEGHRVLFSCVLKRAVQLCWGRGVERVF